MQEIPASQYNTATIVGRDIQSVGSHNENVIIAGEGSSVTIHTGSEAKPLVPIVILQATTNLLMAVAFGIVVLRWGWNH